MSRSRRVLIIDDDRDLAESLAELIEARGHTVAVAFSGDEGLAKFRAQEFDLVLVDVKMPRTSGVDTFIEIRKLGRATNVMMMTGFSIEQLLREAIETGTLRLLRQTFTGGDVVAILRRSQRRGVVLVTSDRAGFANKIEPLLAAHGYNVSIAHSSGEAFSRVLDGRADCLVLDRQLPTAYGLDVYLSLKWTGRSVPTIIVAGGAQDEGDALDLLRPMADVILKKPFDPEQVLSEIDQWQGVAA